MWTLLPPRSTVARRLNTKLRWDTSADPPIDVGRFTACIPSPHRHDIGSVHRLKNVGCRNPAHHLTLVVLARSHTHTHGHTRYSSMPCISRNMQVFSIMSFSIIDEAT